MNKAQPDFDIDLKVGEIGEGKVRELLTNKSIKFEIKNDRMARDTGNLFFEYKCNGKPSGLATTKAEWFVVTFDEHDNQVHIFFNSGWLKKRLKKLLVKGRAKKIHGVGEDNKVSAVLLKISDILYD